MKTVQRNMMNIALMIASNLGTGVGNAMRALKSPSQLSMENATPQNHVDRPSSKKSRGLHNGGRPMFKQNRRAQMKRN